MSWPENPETRKPVELVHGGLATGVTIPINLKINDVVAAIGGEEDLDQTWRKMHQALLV